MVITEEVNSWELMERLWGMGLDNFRCLVSIYKGQDFIDLCEEMKEEWDIGELNDWLAYDFDNVCEYLGIVRLIDDAEIIKWLYENADGATLTHSEINEQSKNWSWDEIMNAIHAFRNRHADVADVENWIKYNESERTITCAFDHDNILFDE